MGLTALDIAVLLFVAGAAILGGVRGFVTEVLSLFAWVAIVFAVKLAHLPLARALATPVGTVSGGALLAYVLIAGTVYILGRMVATAIGRRTRQSVLGPLDRALGFGFGAAKGLLLASLAFLAVILFFDTVFGPGHRPASFIQSRTYPLLTATSASIADFVDRRRRGQPVFGVKRPAAKS